MTISSREHFLPLTKNCLAFEETKRGVLPLRFDPRQLSRFAQEAGRKIRSLCPTGVCLEFSTDAAYVILDYEIADPVRDWYFFDIWIDGVLSEHHGQRPIKSQSGSLRITLDSTSGSKRVTVYLPHTVNVFLKSLNIPSTSPPDAAEDPDDRIICFGDSITQGVGAYFPSSTYPVMLSRLLGLGLLNQGLGGYYFDREGLPETLEEAPKIVTVAFGTNDWSRVKDAAELEENCRLFFDRLMDLAGRSEIWAITPLWRTDALTLNNGLSFEALSDVIRKVCISYGSVSVIDGMTLVPHVTAYFRDERLHPNDLGFLHYGLNLYRSCREFR